MGRLANLLADGGTVRRFVATPFTDDVGLMAEVQSIWVQHNEANREVSIPRLAGYEGLFEPDIRQHRLTEKLNVVPVLKGNFRNVITTPAESVLYILAHSNGQEASLGGYVGVGMDAPVERWTPEQVVTWLTTGPSPLPIDMLCVKIWSCYSGTNGFLPKFQRLMVGAGYRRTIVVGYTRATGGMYGRTAVPGEFLHSKAVLTDDGQLVGRAKDHRVVLGGPPRVPDWGTTNTWKPKPLPAAPPLPVAPPPPPAAADDPYDEVDVAAAIRQLRMIDEVDRLQHFMPPRPGPL